MSWLRNINKTAMITHVAIKDTDGHVWSLPSPNRHGDIVKLIQQEKNASYLLSKTVHGFLNDKGEFLTRKEAWYEAHESNQLLPPYNPINPSQRAGTPSNQPAPLFSEDVW